MTANGLCLVGIILYLGNGITGFLFDSSSCDTYYGDFNSYLLNDGSAVPKVVFVRDDPILIREVVIDVTHCAEYASLFNRNFSVKYMDAADTVLKGQFKVLTSSPRVSTNTNPIFHDYKLLIQFDGTPALSRTLMIDSDIQGTCAPAIIVSGCDQEAKLCPFGCHNGGECVGISRCNCPAGWAGARCDTNFTDPEIYDISVGVVSEAGAKVTSDDGEFQFQLFDAMEYVDSGSNKRNTREASRRHGHDHHHHGSFHVHDHGGYAHCSHHGHDCNDVFGHDPHGDFTTRCDVSYGHDHHGHTHLYSTNHHDNNHHQPHLGASLEHTAHHLTMTVNTGHDHCHLSVPHNMRPDHHHTVVSSFSSSHGCSLYVDGHHVGSQAPSPAPVSTSNPRPPQPFCMGHCTYVNTGSQFNCSLSNLMFTSGSLQNMVTNGIASLLGGALGSLFQAKKPQQHITTTPSTTRTTRMTTSVRPVVTLNKQTHPTTVTTTTTTTTTTPPPITTTAAFGLQSAPICFDCGPMSTDGQCQNVKMCSSGEVCLVFEDHGKYTHHCLEKNTCLTAKSTVASGCWNCCTGYLCNESCPAPCTDEPLCATVQATGYNVCTDPGFASKNCQKTCNLCTASG